MNSIVRLNPALDRRAGHVRDDGLPSASSPKPHRLIVSITTADMAAEALEPICTPADKRRAIRHVIDCLSVEAERLSENILLRLQTARNAAVARRRT